MPVPAWYFTIRKMLSLDLDSVFVMLTTEWGRTNKIFVTINAGASDALLHCAVKSSDYLLTDSTDFCISYKNRQKCSQIHQFDLAICETTTQLQLHHEHESKIVNSISELWLIPTVISCNSFMWGLTFIIYSNSYSEQRNELKLINVE